MLFAEREMKRIFNLNDDRFLLFFRFILWFFLQHVAKMFQRNVFRFVDDFFVCGIDGLLDHFFVLIRTAIGILEVAKIVYFFSN